MLNQILYQLREDLKSIPFVESIMSYTKDSLTFAEYEFGTEVKYKLEYKLLEELSSTAEVTLQSALDSFIEKGNTNFDEFTEKMISSIAIDYPVLDKILRIKANNFSNHIQNIVYRFQKDLNNIQSTFNLNDTKIVDIDVSLGDGHNGEGTSLICLSSGTKLIYKPRNLAITNSYNSFIDWVNLKLKTDLKTFKILDCGNYGWLEFVNYEKANSQKDLQEYYYKSGILLAVTLLLGSKDCHHENLITSGKNPILIDHETIIQPIFDDQSFRIWDTQHKVPLFSVLESFLIINLDKGASFDIVGYGVKGNVEVTELDKTIINPNTIHSKRTTRFTTRKIVDKNVPLFEGKYIFVNDYKEYFIDGFSSAYDLFLSSKEELKSHDSPLQAFKNNEVRYIWRPTFVYFKILKYMRAASFMSSFEEYNLKLYELLSKAFKGDNKRKYKFILDFEMKQMLNGDVPIFSLNSKDDFLEGQKSLKIFEHNCIENIFHRIDLFSSEHKNEQLRYINNWISM
ncbi:MAG: type 2 lanthipeptide synthetase LanM [Spirosomaceae bacterium]|jgi:type 2 lantibiotic biosynthesis protein LanM|nr:type 2 lanthipeptide synthetase LanM [Spirosomataceae bacterium]